MADTLRTAGCSCASDRLKYILQLKIYYRLTKPTAATTPTSIVVNECNDEYIERRVYEVSN